METRHAAGSGEGDGRVAFGGWACVPPDDLGESEDAQYGWPAPPSTRARVGFLPWLDWKFSAILPLALLLLLATLLWNVTNTT